MLKATVSGSFHRHMLPIYEAVGSLKDAGVDVLSPSDPRVVDYIGDFLFVASDKLRSIKLVQDRHLAAIRASDFLWVVCPDGYTGASTSMEIGAAHALGVPVFSLSAALDSTIGAYVKQVGSLRDAINTAIRSERPMVNEAYNILLDPASSIEGAHQSLDTLKGHLTGITGDRGAGAEKQLSTVAADISSLFGPYR